MYKGFNINITKEFFEDEYNKYHTIGEKLKINSETTAYDILNKYIMDDIIDGNKIEDEWFKKQRADIFISYSHNDVDLVKTFAGWINKKFGLTVFFDEALWGKADDLLYEIDKKYCLNEDKSTYSYEKRNLSTSHVHSMLTVSIMKMIDLSECIFFINTEESIPITQKVIEGDKNYTMSPWLYQELSIVNNIQIKELKYYRRNLILENSKEIKSYQNLNVKYEADLRKLIKLKQEYLIKWKNAFEMEKYFQGDKNALDILYKLIET